MGVHPLFVENSGKIRSFGVGGYLVISFREVVVGYDLHYFLMKLKD